MTLTGFMAWTWGGDNSIGPQMYSWYHIMWLIIMVGLCVGAVFFAKKYKDPKVVDRTILIVDAILLTTEVLKQLMYHVGYYGYLRIDVLPFSLCSIPMYVALFGSLVKNEKIKNACYGFLAFFGIVGGLSSMLYPVTLYTSLIYTSFQTMLWHTLLVAMAFYIITAKGYGESFKKDVLPAFIIFAACSLIAVGLNELTYHTYLEPRQTPNCKVDRNPGSYEYYKYGFEDNGKFYYLDEKDGVITITEKYGEANNVVITYPGDDYSVFNLRFDDNNGNEKYIEIDSNKDVVLVDNPTNTWTFAWITADRAVFAMNVDGVNYVIGYENNTLKSCDVAAYTEGQLLGDFIDGEMLSEGDAANFFFISNHCETPIPVLNLIQPKVPYPVFVLIYIGGFFTVSSAIWGATYGIRKLTTKKEQ